MKKIALTIGMIASILLLEFSGSAFFSHRERPYFLLFSFLALLVMENGFLRALPLTILILVSFEGITQSVIGPISLYGILFSYGMSFLLKRFHLERGGEKIFLALAAGIGMALYPVFAFEYISRVSIFSFGTFFGWVFLQDTFLGAVLLLFILRCRLYFRKTEVSYAPSFFQR